jgi:hypothetical protein
MSKSISFAEDVDDSDGQKGTRKRVNNTGEDSYCPTRKKKIKDNEKKIMIACVLRHINGIHHIPVDSLDINTVIEALVSHWETEFTNLKANLIEIVGTMSRTDDGSSYMEDLKSKIKIPKCVVVLDNQSSKKVLLLRFTGGIIFPPFSFSFSFLFFLFFRHHILIHHSYAENREKLGPGCLVDDIISYRE